MAPTSSQVPTSGILSNLLAAKLTKTISDPIARAIADPDFIIEVRMPLFSKARPRLTKTGHAYMPQAYRDSQTEMRRQILEQWPHGPLAGPIGLYVKLYGEGRGDADNLVGALLDAAGPSKGQEGILWEDDRVSVIPCIVVEWQKASKVDSRWVVQIAKLG